MATIITRVVGPTAKGNPLTNSEVDNNFINLNTAKLEASNIIGGYGVDVTTNGSNVTINVQNFAGNCKNVSGVTLQKGTPVYQIGSLGQTITVAAADASDPAKMPAVGVLNETLTNESEGEIIFLGYIFGVNTSTFFLGDEVYVAPGGGYTNVKPTNASGNLIQFLGIVDKIHHSNGSGIIFGTATAQTQSVEKTDSVRFAGITVDGNVSHEGLTFTEGFDIDQLKTITKSITLTTDWQDTGISGSDLSIGTYIVQLFANDIGAGGTNSNEYYSGVMSWYSLGTNSSLEMPTDEIQLHRAGSGGDGSLYLRTYRTPAGFLKLQIYSNSPNTSSSNYVFKFRRVI